MPTRILGALTLFLLASSTASANPASTVSLHEATEPWVNLLRSDNAALHAPAITALNDLIRKHPTAASEVVRSLSGEPNYERSLALAPRLVPLAKDSPATVSALIQLIKQRETPYPARNFCVAVLSQSGRVAATPELVDAMTETYCPVPGAYFRILRALGKDAAPALAVGYRHPNEMVRRRITALLNVLSRTEPVIQQLFERLKAEAPLLQKLRSSDPLERVNAMVALTELARTTPGTATVLIRNLKDERDTAVLAETQLRLSDLGRESPELVIALVAAVRSEDDYRLRNLAVKVLPKVGPNLNTREMVEALGDDECPVPGAMRRILLAAGPDALPVLSTALKHNNANIRSAAATILERMPRPATVAGATNQP